MSSAVAECPVTHLLDREGDFLQLSPHRVLQLLDIDPLCSLGIVDRLGSHPLELAERESGEVFFCFRDWIWFVSVA